MVCSWRIYIESKIFSRYLSFLCKIRFIVTSKKNESTIERPLNGFSVKINSSFPLVNEFPKTKQLKLNQFAIPMGNLR